ncbi:MAG: hypothetical protein ACRDL9_05420 [Trebonia sp.]
MRGHRRLRDTELGLDGRGQLAGRPLAAGQQFQDAPPDRVAKNVERVHAAIASVQTYIRWI